MAVFRYIRQKDEPLSLPELLAVFGSEFAERSLRRWLQEMVAEGLLEKKGSKRGTKYLAKMLAPKTGLDFNPQAAGITSSIKHPLFRQYTGISASFGVNIIRVKYRQQRRDMVRFIIVNKLHKKKLENYISAESKKLIPEKDLEEFIKCLYEDLRELGPPTISGLGVSVEELRAWLKLREAQ